MNTLSTLERKAHIALEDVRTQFAICNELNKQITAEPEFG